MYVCPSQGSISFSIVAGEFKPKETPCHAQSGMKASRMSLHVGCALGAWTRMHAFVPPLADRLLKNPYSISRTASSPCTRPSSTPSAIEDYLRQGSSSFIVGFRKQIRSCSRRQYRLFMSSNQGMNPESFTERAWDAMARLPTLADANRFQVIMIGASCHSWACTYWKILRGKGTL